MMLAMEYLVRAARHLFDGNAAHAVGRDLPALLRRLLELFLDTLLPPQCVACRAPVAELGRLCGSCWRAHVPVLRLSL